MKIKTLAIDGFRNLTGLDISLSPGLNVFWGDNGQGKTNILECIWMLSGVRSFRGARERELFGFDAKRIKAALSYTDRDRLCEVAANLPRAGRREITANGVPMERMSKLFGKLQAVIFTPVDLSLSGGEPAARRAFLDLSVSQIKVSYAEVLSRYNRILAQRNAYLKTLREKGGGGIAGNLSGKLTGQLPGDTAVFDLDIWDTQLARTGAFLSVYRNVYIKTLTRTASEIYRELTGSRETLTLAYRSGVYKDGVPETVETSNPEYYLERMRSHIDDDKRLGMTLVGIHRDDLLISVNGTHVREYGSQGQQRSAALALKLAGARILALEREEAPVILLDDVLSELDSGRRDFILKNLSGFQTLITTCEAIHHKNCKKFHVQNGQIMC